MRNRVPQPDLDRGKKETVGQKTCGGNQCPNIMPLPHNESQLSSRYAFMLFLKLKREGECLIFMGSSFHCFAPSTIKDRS